MAIRKFPIVGAVPRWMLWTNVLGERTRMHPTTTSTTWVTKSMTARKMFRPAASLTPTTLIAARSATITIPPITSPGEWRSGDQKTPR